MLDTENLSGGNLPSRLGMHGEADEITLPSGTKDFLSGVSSKDRTLWSCPKLVHDLLHEPEGADMQDGVLRWLNAHTVPLPPPDGSAPASAPPPAPPAPPPPAASAPPADSTATPAPAGPPAPPAVKIPVVPAPKPCHAVTFEAAK